MDQDTSRTRSRLTTPRAAAIAGILFSLLLITSLVLVRISVPANPLDAGDWLARLFGNGDPCFEPRAVRRDCFLVVHRRGARPPGEQ